MSDSGDIREPAGIRSEIAEELHRIEQVRQMISTDTVPKRSYGIFFGMIVVNILLFWHFQSIYLYIWVASSLYFYLFYPMLPLALFPFRMVYEKATGKKPLPKTKESMLTWAKNLEIFSHKRVGYHLFMKFFLYSMIPITYGVLCIYGISVFFTIIIAMTSSFPGETLSLILIQCLGIMGFYAEIFYFKGVVLPQAHRMVKNKVAHHRRIVMAIILAGAFILISTILVILMIIAMVMPAFTLTTFINMVAFSYAGRNMSVIIVLFSQFIIMQYLQSMLSRSFALNRIMVSHRLLSKATENIPERDVNNPETRRSLTSILLESRLYAYNRRYMLGLFPTYSVGVNIPTLLSIKSLSVLEDVVLPNDIKTNPNE